MKIASIGYGKVGGALADKLSGLGHELTLAAADPRAEGVLRLVAKSPRLRVSSPREAVLEAEAVILATPFGANVEVLTPLRDALRGKVLIDCTNPVGPGLTHALKSERSGAETIQALVPACRVVKAFSIYGFENLEDHAFDGDARPVMMFCGDERDAKAQVATLIAELGWDPLDVGPLAQALHLEHMTLLWVRMVRAGHHSPHLVWAALRR